MFGDLCVFGEVVSTSPLGWLKCFSTCARVCVCLHQSSYDIMGNVMVAQKPQVEWSYRGKDITRMSSENCCLLLIIHPCVDHVGRAESAGREQGLPDGLPTLHQVYVGFSLRSFVPVICQIDAGCSKSKSHSSL